MADTQELTPSMELLLHAMFESGLSPNWKVSETIHAQAYGGKREKQAEAITEVSALSSLSDFECLELLGQGGMSQIHLAQQGTLHRKVALKRIRPERLNPATMEALLYEARITGALQHPNIAPIYALGREGEDGGQPIIVMKRIEGVSWEELIDDDHHPFWGRHPRGSDPPLVRHLKILLEVCDAIHFAHSQGIIHRDIKPSNVMVGEFGEVMVLDWGIALPFAEVPPHLKAAQALLEPGKLYGTPAYMAPEMAISGEVLGPYTDIYLLGAVLHRILTGEHKHLGDTVREILFSVFSTAPYAYDDNCPAGLAAICKKATQEDARDRFATVLEFQDAISGYLLHRDSIVLAQAAQEKLQELEAQGPVISPAMDTAQGEYAGATYYSELTACRFGFQSALQIWPENPEALEGLQASLSRMFDHAIADKNLRLAADLIEQMPEPDASHHEARDELLVQLTREEERALRLKQLAHESDLRVSEGQRTTFLMILGAVVFALLSSVIYLSFIKKQAGSHGRSIAYVTLIALILGLTVLWKREALLKNKINRNFLSV